MFPTRVPGFGNTTNLNRKRLRRRSTSPVVGRRSRPSLEALETRQLLSTYAVTNTNDSGAGSLRQAIINANGDSSPDNIVFDIPASTAPNLDVPVGALLMERRLRSWHPDLADQAGQLRSQRSLTRFRSTDILKLTMLACRIAIQASRPRCRASSSVVVRRAGPSPSPPHPRCLRTPRPPIPWNASADVVQAALGAIVGPNNVTVTGGPAPNTDLLITFQNKYAQQTIQPLVATNNLTGGTNPGISVSTIDPGGTVLPNPDLTYIQSIPNTVDAKDGNNAKERVIIDGSQTGGCAHGFVLDASHSLLRGLIISGFNVGVSVPALDTSRQSRGRQPDPGQLHRRLLRLPRRPQHGICPARPRITSASWKARATPSRAWS